MFLDSKNYSYVTRGREYCKKLSKRELDTLTVTSMKNVERCSKSREVKIDLAVIEKLRYYERCREDIALYSGLYKPMLSYKIGGREQGGFIVAYNLYEFMDKTGRVVVPEGVSVIQMIDELVCKSIKFPKSLSVIVSLKIKCSGRVNLKNVRYISGLEVDAKEVLLPYTLEYIATKGLILCGSTVVRSETTPSGTYYRVGSLDRGAIVDNRRIQNYYSLSNRFVNLYVDSLGGGKLFQECDIRKIDLTEEMYIDKHYPDYLYTVKKLDQEKMLA